MIFHWVLWASMLDRVNGLAARIARGDNALEEHLRDAAQDRFESIVNEYDETRAGTVESWVMYKLRFIMTKRVGAFKRRRAKIAGDPGEHPRIPSYRVDFAQSLEVSELLDALEVHDRSLLVMHLVLGMTFEEMGDKLGVSRNTARNYYLKAIEAARCQANSETRSGEEHSEESP